MLDSDHILVDLSAVIVNWNSGRHLAAAVRSLRDLPLKQIVVVDNASDDFSGFACIDAEKLKIVELDANLGFAGGANLGIKQVDTAFVLLLNPDVEVSPQAVQSLLACAIDNSRVAIVAGSLVGEDQKPQHGFQVRSLPTLWGGLKDALLLDEILPQRPEVDELFDSPGPHPVEQPAAACWLLRRRAWELLGGFDESFFPAWFEDVDFCRRLKDSGWEVFFFPHIEFRHQGGSSLKKLGYRRFLKIYYSNLLKYWKKHRRRNFYLLWLPVQLGLVVRLLVAKDE